jgi:hypothetical protein
MRKDGEELLKRFRDRLQINNPFCTVSLLINVSVETVGIVEGLPELKIDS